MAAVGDGDPGGLLAAVLQREEAEVREPGDVPLDATGRRRRRTSAAPLVGLCELVEPDAEDLVAADVADPRTSTSAPVGSGSTCSAGSATSDLAADLAEQRERVVRRGRARRRPRVHSAASASATASPPSADVVDERQRVLPGARHVPDERRLARRGRATATRRDVPQRAWSLGAGERQRRARAGEQDRVALPPAARHASHVRDEPDTAHHGRRRGSSGRRCRCRARRCPETIGTPSASHAWAMPSIDSASSQPISGFSGLPKLRQSVKPSGSPPAHATLRAASRTASCPARRGSSEPSRPCPSSVRASPRHGRPQPQDGRVEPGPADVRDWTSWS